MNLCAVLLIKPSDFLDLILNHPTGTGSDLPRPTQSLCVVLTRNCSLSEPYCPTAVANPTDALVV